MTCKMFESIFHVFKFGEKPKFENDPLSKLRMILEQLNTIMLSIFSPKFIVTWRSSDGSVHQKLATQTLTQILRVVYL